MKTVDSMFCGLSRVTGVLFQAKQIVAKLDKHTVVFCLHIAANKWLVSLTSSLQK